jgi:hypothetical protein
LLVVAVFDITEGMTQNFSPRAFRRKKGDDVSGVHGNVTTACWKDKSGRYITPTYS